MEDQLAYLSDLSWAYRQARVLQISNLLGIYTILSKSPMSVKELSAKCESPPEMLEKLLIASVAMGLLERQGLTYKNTKLSEKYLVKGLPLYQGDIISHSASVWHFWDKLEQDMCPAGKRADDDELGHENFIRGMHNITVAGRGQIFLDSIDLSNCKKLFDVGGGPATYSILACKKYPQLKAVLFDLPETTKIAREMIAKESMTDRISTVDGDWEKDDFGADNDAVLFSNVLHGPSSKAEMKLKKAYDSMLSGGLLIIQEFLLNDEKTGPLIPSLFNIMVGAYSCAELMSVITNAGFVNPELVAESEQIGCGWITAVKP